MVRDYPAAPRKMSQATPRRQVMIVALSQRAALSSRESGMNDRCERRSNGSTAPRGAALIERVRKCKKLPDRELREFRRGRV